MRTEFLTLMFGGLMVSGCSGDMYSATSTKDGVFILNKLTGTVRQVKGDRLVELPDGQVQPPEAPSQHRPPFQAQGIPKQPFLISCISKYRDGMLLASTTRPIGRSYRAIGWLEGRWAWFVIVKLMST
jgi:hypothetical protein